MLLQNIWEFITTHYSAIIATISAAASIIAVIIARKVFKDGLKVNRNKVLDEFSLELVTEFIIPFND